MNDETENINGNAADEPAPEVQATDENTPNPKWTKGMRSPNPAGRPKTIKSMAELREAAREKTMVALDFLSRTVQNSKAPIGVRLGAATELLNRGWGRPQQSLDVNHGVQDTLAAFLEQLDERNKIKTVTGAVLESTLALEQPLQRDGQGGAQDSVPIELGAREPDK